MGQEAQNNNRQASLDDKKERAAGRRNTRAQIAGRETDAKGKTSGAFGKDNLANRRTSASGVGDVGRSTKRTRSRDR